MLKPFIRRPGHSAPRRTQERGVTMALVALAMVGIIAMAALSIDVGTLYQASAEAQRSADAAALAAARVLSLSGITGDPSNSSGVWSNACNAAVQVATSVGGQNNVGGVPSTVTVTFSATDGSGCTSPGGAFGVNPMVTVKVANTTLPTFFAHVFGLFNSNWNNVSASGSATAEVYNPSNSGSFAASGEMVPVQPRCVKPLIVPNQDPGNAAGCVGVGCPKFVNLTAGTTEGTITNPGIGVGGPGAGIIGRTFNLFADCTVGAGTCYPPVSLTPAANPTVVPAPGPPNLQYVPGQLSPGAPIAVPGCATATPFQQAIAGCDQSTAYHCGVPAALTFNANEVDLSENPSGPAGDTASATQCLIKEAGVGSISGQDQLVTTSFPYQITAGSSNPLGAGGDVTSSNSIITIPIFDSSFALAPNGSGVAPVTIVGFLQVFVNQVNADVVGSLNVTVLNVAGCGNGSPPGTPFVTGTSPVPIRLITPP